MNKSVDNMTNIQTKSSSSESKSTLFSVSDRDNSRRSNMNTATEKSDRVKQEYISRNRDSFKSAYQSANIPLLLFDLILLPIIIIRMVLIYFWGSKYNLKGFQFLDVIMHADNPYFNQEDCRLIDTIGKDYRIVLRDDSRLFPLDLVSYVRVEHETEKHISIHGEKPVSSNSISSGNNNKSPGQIIIGTTVNKIPSIWEISSDEIIDDRNHEKKIHDEQSNVERTIDLVQNNQNLLNKIKTDTFKSDELTNATKKDKLDVNISKKKGNIKDDSDSESSDSDEEESEASDDTNSDDSDETDTNELEESTETNTDNKKTYHSSKRSLQSSDNKPKNNVKVDKAPSITQQKISGTRKPEVKGVNYFESNDDGTKKRDTKKRNDILDSIKDELNSVFDP